MPPAAFASPLPSYHRVDSLRHLSLIHDAPPTAAQLRQLRRDPVIAHGATMVAASSRFGLKRIHVPRVVHTIVLDDVDDATRQALAGLAQSAQAQGFTVVLWTNRIRGDIPDSMRDLATQHGILPANIDEGGAPMQRLDEAYRSYVSLGTPTGRRRASLLAGAEILHEYGGVLVQPGTQLIGDLAGALRLDTSGLLLGETASGGRTTDVMAAAAKSRGTAALLANLAARYAQRFDQLAPPQGAAHGQDASDAVNQANTAQSASDETVRRMGAHPPALDSLARALYGPRADRNRLRTLPAAVIAAPQAPFAHQQHPAPPDPWTAVRRATHALRHELERRPGGIYLPAAHEIIVELPESDRSTVWKATIEAFHHRLDVTTRDSLRWVSTHNIHVPAAVATALQNLFRAVSTTTTTTTTANQLMSAWLASPTLADSQLFLDEHAAELVIPAAREDLLQRAKGADRSTANQLLTHQEHLALLDLVFINQMGAGYDYLKGKYNPDRRAALLRALPGTGHAMIAALARLARANAATPADRADAVVMELLANAMTVDYEAGHEPRGIPDLGRNMAYEWISKVGQLKRLFPQYSDALEALTVQTLAQCV